MPVQDIRLPNHVCHRKDRPTQRDRNIILFRRGIDHYSVPVPNLRHIEATAIAVNIDLRTIKRMTLYLPPRSLVDANQLESISRGATVILAGDLNVKLKDWNSRLNFPREVLLREFESVNSSIVLGPDSPNTNPTAPL